jgi:sugar/nucleoside kinase (ribokinase family)
MKSRLEKQKRPKIVGTGLFALDMVLDHEGKVLSHGVGGSAGNVLSILAGFGWEVVPIAELGADLAGEFIFQEFSALNADLSYLHKSSGYQTPVVYQHQLGKNSPKTHEFSFACPRCGEKRPLRTSSTLQDGRVDIEHLGADVLYLDRATKLGVQLAEYYHDRDVLIVFEPSAIGPEPELFQRALNAAHVIKYADERLADLQSFEITNVSVEICTMGAAGLRYRAPSLGHEWVILDAFQVPELVDTSGAGDWCTAGMIYHLFNEAPAFDIRMISYNRLYRASRFGQALSALNCMTLGARGLTAALSSKNIIHRANHLKNSRLNCELRRQPMNNHSSLEAEYTCLTSKSRRTFNQFDAGDGDGICCAL